MADAPTPPLLTRDQIVWKEGRDAARRKLTKKDNPYRAGSADDRSWLRGFSGKRDG